MEYLILAAIAVLGLSLLGLVPTKAVREQLGTLLAADATTLAPATNANKIALVVSNFVPSETLDITTLTMASFTGSTPIAGATGAQDSGIDPVTGQQVITIKAPAGGWLWSCTATPTPAQTVFGYILTDNAGTTLLGSALLPAPVTINASGQFIDLGKVDIDFVLSPMS